MNAGASMRASCCCDLAAVETGEAMSSSEELYSRAESEGGQVIDDPSEDAIYIMMGELDLAENTFVTIEPLDENLGWYVSIARRSEGGYEIEVRDPLDREHDISVEFDPSRAAKRVTQWMAQRPRSRRNAAQDE